MLETWGTRPDTKAEDRSFMLLYVSFTFQIRGLTYRLANRALCDFQLGKMSFVMKDKDNERPQRRNQGLL